MTLAYIAAQSAVPVVWKLLPLIFYLAVNAILVIEFFWEGHNKGAKLGEILFLVGFLLACGGALLFYVGLRKMVDKVLGKGGDTSSSKRGNYGS